MRRGAIWLGLMCGAAMLAGCTYERVLNDPWSSLRRFEDRRSLAADDPITASGTQDQGCAILLESFEGDKAPARAQARVRQLARTSRVPDLWIRDWGNKIQVLRGRYASDQDPAAQNDLRQMRMVELDGLRPFEHVEIVALADAVQTGRDAAGGAVPGAPGAAVAVSSGPLDLKGHSGMYTLQIGFYDEQFGKDFRKAAEQAAAALRTEGAEAYYYQGPNRALITVGLFTEEDFGVETSTAADGSKVAATAYGPRVRELQQKYPYNLANGVTMVQMSHGQRLGEQPSFLVKVP